MRQSFLFGLIPAVAFAATIAVTKEARANPHLDFDLDLGTALQSAPNQERVDFSFGGGMRLGYRFQIIGAPVWIQPEVGGHYMRFGTNSSDLGGYDYAGTLTGGVRLGLQGIVQPHVFGHLGLGFLGFAVDPNTVQGYVGPAGDIGFGLDFKLVPGFTLGGQLAYNAVTILSNDIGAPGYAARWFSFGLTAGFHFSERPAHRVVYYR
jgi:hypothetical protein